MAVERTCPSSSPMASARTSSARSAAASRTPGCASSRAHAALSQARPKALRRAPRAAVLPDLVSYMTSGRSSCRCSSEKAVAKNREIMVPPTRRSRARHDPRDLARASSRTSCTLRQLENAAREISYFFARRSSARAEAGGPRPDESHRDETNPPHRDQPARPDDVRLERSSSAMGEKPFRARQLMKWIYRRAVEDFESMTDLGKDFRAGSRGGGDPRAGGDRLAAPVTAPASGAAARERAGIEMVFIPSPPRTLCISSQVGCAMDCTFCSTAQQGSIATSTRPRSSAGLAREPRARLLARRRPRDHQRRVQGMASRSPTTATSCPPPSHDGRLGLDLSRRRVTVSTSGLVPQ